MLGLGNLLSKGKVLGFPNKYSFNFDGDGDYLDCGASNVLVTGTNVTLSCWFKVDGTSRGYLIQNQKGAGSTNLTIQVNSNDSSETAGYVGVIIWSGAGHNFISVDGSVDDGAWHHLALTTTSSAQVLYLDGASVATGSNTFTNASSTDSTLVGNDGGSNYDFDGLIDEVAVFNTALSADDIAKLASKPLNLSKASSYDTDRTANLKLWLRAGDKVLPEEDASIARADYFCDFDGTDDYVSVADNASLTQASGFTVTCWVKFDSISGDTCIVAKHADYADVDNTGEFFIINDDGICEFVVLDHTNSASIGTYTGTVFAVDTWYHVTCAYDGGTASSGCLVYINGLLQAHNANATGSGFSSINDTSQPLTIGAFADAGEPHNGQISNLTMAQTALDAQTIKQFAKSRFTPIRENNRFSVVDFDGSNDYIETSSNLGITGASARTFGLWFKPTAIDQLDFLLEWGGTGVASATCGLYLYQSKIYFYGWAGGDLDTGVAPLLEWQHLYATYDGTTVKVYLNGSLIGSGAKSLNTANTPLSIGIGNSNEFDGSISSVSIYNVAKSAEEVYALYSKGITYDESSLSGLVAYYRMGSGTGDAYPTIKDQSTNSNDGTITNGASDDIVQQMVAGYDLGAFESTGEELDGNVMLNGDFASGDLTSWNAVSGGSAMSVVNNSLVHAVGTSGGVRQAVTLTSGVLYKGSFDILEITSGNNGDTTIQITIYNYAGSSAKVALTQYSAGTNTFYFVPDDNGIWFEWGTGNGFTIDNFTLKTVLQSSDLSDTYPAIIDVNEPVLGADIIGTWVNNGYNTLTVSTSTISSGISDGSGDDLATNSFTAVSGELYKLNINLTLNSGTAPSVFIADDTSGSTSTGSTAQTLTSGENNIYWFGDSGATRYVTIKNASTATNLSLTSTIKKVNGNVGAMTNQAADDLVYSSVLPDQSFLVGNSSPYNFLDLDGSDEYIDCGDGTSLDITSSITLSCWMNADAIDQYGFIAGRDDGTNRNYNLEFYTDEKIYWTCNGLSDTQVVSTTTLSAGSWYHVAGVYDGSNIKLYINGVEEDSDSSTGSIDNDDVSFTIGAREAGMDRHFNGKIGQSAIWNKALSSTEVGAIYTLGRHGNLLNKYSDNLVGYWAMSALDDNTGLKDVGNGTIYDRSGQSNHGTATNTEAADLASSPNADPEGYAKGDTNRSTTKP